MIHQFNQKLLPTIGTSYRKPRALKNALLDSVCETCGYHRMSAPRLIFLPRRKNEGRALKPRGCKRRDNDALLMRISSVNPYRGSGTRNFIPQRDFSNSAGATRRYVTRMSGNVGEWVFRRGKEFDTVPLDPRQQRVDERHALDAFMKLHKR